MKLHPLFLQGIQLMCNNTLPEYRIFFMYKHWKSIPEMRDMVQKVGSLRNRDNLDDQWT